MVYKGKVRKPRYAELAEEIRNGITNRHWLPGDVLPSETEFCKIFGVSRGTVVRAVDELQQEGLIHRRQGVGTFVTRPSLHRKPGFLQSFSETVRRQGMTPTHKLIEHRALTKDEAAQYGCNEAATLLKRIRFVDSVAWAIHTAIVPDRIVVQTPEISSDTTSAETASTYTKPKHQPNVGDPEFSLYETLERANVKVDQAYEAINTRLATTEETVLLDTTEPCAVMLVHRRSVDSRGTLIELSEAVYLGECYTYDAHLVRSRGVVDTRNTDTNKRAHK